MKACRVGRYVLGNEILGSARYAVVVSPAINDGQFRAPVAVYRRRVWRLPLERRRPPWIAGRLLPVEVARDHVVEKNHLRRSHDQRRRSDKDVEIVRRI